MKLPFLLYLPRREDDSMFPALLALVLAVLMVVQFLISDPIDLPEATVDIGRNTAAEPFVTDSVEAARIIVESDVFSPVRSAGGGGDASFADPLGGAIVAGSLSVRGRAYAMVISPGGQVSRLAPGSRINGWTLLSLSSNGARFGRGTERIDLSYGAQASQTVAAIEEPEE
ncbi:MAG: hypothetical protein ACO1OX_02535 [Novosphingobium sp.]